MRTLCKFLSVTYTTVNQFTGNILYQFGIPFRSVLVSFGGLPRWRLFGNYDMNPTSFDVIIYPKASLHLVCGNLF